MPKPFSLFSERTLDNLKDTILVEILFKVYTVETQGRKCLKSRVLKSIAAVPLISLINRDSISKLDVIP